MKRLRFFSIVLVLSGFFACKHEIPQFTDIDNGGGGGGGGGGEDCDPGTVYFQQQILPIFQSSCAVPDCHSSVNPQEGLVLNSYNSIMGSGEITPGNPGEGDIFESLTEEDPEDIMPQPPYDPLSAEQIQLIQIWIQQGALNNSCASLNCDTLEVTFNADIWPIIENSCQGCHSGNSPQGNLSLNDYSQISTIAGNGSLYGSVSGDPDYTAMPYNASSLSDCQIEMIRLWVENGYPND
jgi:hypothetical protein